MFQQLEDKIKKAYEEGVTLDEAEKLAAEFLYATLKVSSELKNKDLNSRMRKQGVKAIRAALYTDIKSKADKVTEAAITAQLDAHELVAGEQEAFDLAEVERDELERMYNVYTTAHVYFRQLSRGVQG